MGAVKLPVRETATELARRATGESVRRVRDIAQRGYDSSNDQPIYLHNDHLIGADGRVDTHLNVQTAPCPHCQRVAPRPGAVLTSPGMATAPGVVPRVPGMLPPSPSVLPIPDVVTTPGMVRPGVLPRVAGVVTPSPSVVLIPGVPPEPTVLPVAGAPMPIAGAAVPPNCGNIGLVGPVGVPPDPPFVLNPFPKIPGSVRPVEVPPDPLEELKP
jgi:hypothetical protein